MAKCNQLTSLPFKGLTEDAGADMKVKMLKVWRLAVALLMQWLHVK